MPINYPTYPKDLPYKPLTQGYKERYTPIIEATDNEFGLYAQRYKRSLPSKRRGITLMIGNERKKDIFYRFWEDDLKLGTSMFRMRVRNTEGDWTLHLVQIFQGVIEFAPFGFESIGRYRGENWEVQTWTVSFEQLVYRQINYDEEDDD